MDFDPKKDYYKILWISEDADEKEIKKVFRKLAMKYHPDRKWWDEEKFKEINEAHEVLSDSQKRQMYDSYRKWWFTGWMWGFWGWANFQWWTFDVSDLFGDMFWDLFWWWRWSSRHSDQPRRWDDISLNVKIKFEDVYNWAKKKIKYSRYVLCNVCNWSWIDKDSKPQTCPTCQGSWVVVQNQRTPFWVIQSQTACPTCHGKWKIWEKACNNCNWQWVTLKEEIVEINIPQWIDNWTRLRMPWMWHYGYKWWTPWDLYIRIVINEDSPRQKRWHDIVIKKDIKLIDAILWWTMEIKLPDKTVKIKIPKWLQINENIIISWQWFKKWNGLLSWKWDLIIQPNIKIPKTLSKEEKRLYEEIKKLNS